MPARPNVGVPWLDLEELPEPLDASRFVLEPLGAEHAARDYEALMSCRERLRCELDWRGWPPEGFTLEDNRADLVVHRAELDAREAFAYTVLTPDRTRCIGCIYLERCDEIGGGLLSHWVVEDAFGVEAELVREVLHWAHRAFRLRRISLAFREQNERGIGVARAEGLAEWVSRVDPVLKAHRCFGSRSTREVLVLEQGRARRVGAEGVSLQPITGWAPHDDYSERYPARAAHYVALPLQAIQFGRGSRMLTPPFVTIAAGDMSRRQVELLPTLGSWAVHDMGSVCGTDVGGAPIGDATVELFNGGSFSIAGYADRRALFFDDPASAPGWLAPAFASE